MNKLGLLGLILTLVGVGFFVRQQGRDREALLEPVQHSARTSGGESGESELALERTERRRQEILQDLRAGVEAEHSAPLEVKRVRGTPIDAALRGQLSSRCGEEGFSGALVLAWGRGPDVSRIDELAAALGRVKSESPFELSEALRDFPSFGVSGADENGAFTLDLRGVMPPLCTFAAKPGFASIRMWVDLEDVEDCTLKLEPLYQARLRLQDSSGRELRIGRAERKMKHVKNPRRRGTLVDPIWAMAGVPPEVLKSVARLQAFVFTGGSCRGKSDGPWRFEIDAPGFHPGVLEFSAGRVGQAVREPVLTLEPDGTSEGLGSLAVYPSGLPVTIAAHQIGAKVILENEITGETHERYLKLAPDQEALYVDDLATGLWKVSARDSCKFYPVPDQRIQVHAGLASWAALDYSGAAFLYPRDPNFAPGIEQPRELASITYSEAEQERRKALGLDENVASAPRSPTPLPVGPEMWLWYHIDHSDEGRVGTYEDELWVAPHAGYVRILE